MTRDAMTGDDGDAAFMNRLLNKRNSGVRTSHALYVRRTGTGAPSKGKDSRASSG
jgi:hypothetical protein